MTQFDGKLSLSGDGMANAEATAEMSGTYSLLFGLKVEACPVDDQHLA